MSDAQLEKTASPDPRARRSRQALRDAFLALLADQPLDQITITELTRVAGIGYTTFFRHYPDKDALLADIAADEIRDLLALSVPILMRVSSFESCRAICAHVERRRALWKALLTGGAGGAVRAEFLRQARNLIPAGFRSASRVPIEVSTLYSSSGTLEVLAWWLEEAAPVPVDEMAAILDSLIAIPATA